MRRHHRHWRRLWLYCWCGFRWTCPDAAPVVPMPFNPDPTPPRPRNQRALWHVSVGRPWRNQRPSWDGPTGFGHRVGRAGRLTPAQQARATAGSTGASARVER
ncbi:hypothetical protein [Plantactinospora sp. B24E8]|uniref:hypothetical protein n=1 Tax=Plantactinospora sp. B24E8 TaxID=3153567 RepID=UPI00325E1F63